MSEEVEKREHDLLPIWQADGSVALPITREIIGPDSTIPQLARAIGEIDLLTSNFKAVRNAVDGWVKQRATKEATKTLKIPLEQAVVMRDPERSGMARAPKAIEVKGTEFKRVYPGERLRSQLTTWVREGKISQAAADRACREKTVYEPLLPGIDAICRAQPELAPYLKAMEEQEPSKQYVNLT